MNWTMMGWGVIGFAAVLLILFTLLLKRYDFYAVRNNSGIDSLHKMQIAAIEGGKSRQVVIGNDLNVWSYPGLGLHALSSLPGFLSQESIVSGGLSIAAGAGEMAVFARQIVRHHYHDGFSLGLHRPFVETALTGPSTWSLTAGLLSTIPRLSEGSTAFLGYFGSEALLWSEDALASGSDAFSAGGTMAAQAVLFLNVQHLLIGEEVFRMPENSEDDISQRAGWLTEDILRLLVMFGLVVGAILKLVGVL